MSQANVDQNQLLREIIKKLGRAMDKINFNREIPADEANKIRKEINEVQSSLFIMSDINPDIKNIELFKKSADFVETALNILTKSNERFI
jgi:hypothetical protein